MLSLPFIFSMEEDGFMRKKPKIFPLVLIASEQDYTFDQWAVLNHGPARTNGQILEVIAMAWAVFRYALPKSKISIKTLLLSKSQ